MTRYASKLENIYYSLIRTIEREAETLEKISREGKLNAPQTHALTNYTKLLRELRAQDSINKATRDKRKAAKALKASTADLEGQLLAQAQPTPYNKL